jgi:ribosomal protein S27AE
MRPMTASIDKAMAPLITALWRLGYTTQYCCQGDAADSSGTPENDATRQAYIMLSTRAEAALFAALAGPLAWDKKAHRQRHAERPDGSDRWTWDWHIDGNTVRFPGRDLGRVTVAVQRMPKLIALIGALSGTQEVLRPALPECPECGFALLGALPAATKAYHPAPRTCPTCGGVVLARRKDARYCSRRCQLAARQRGQGRPPKK